MNRIMRKAIIQIIIAAGIIFIFGCEKMTPIQSPEDGELIEVSLAITGDVIVEEYPLEHTKSGETDSQDLFGIQVYQNGEKYAYGLFDNITDMQIYLHTGSVYKFVCSYIPDGKIQLKNFTLDYEPSSGNDSGYCCFYSDYNGYKRRGAYWYSGGLVTTVSYIANFFSTEKYNVYCHGFSYPYALYKRLHGTNYEYGHASQPIYVAIPVSVTNSFVYSDAESMDFLLGDSVMQDFSRGNYPCMRRFYGESENFTPSGSNSTVSINLKATFFMLKCRITGVSDGSASLVIKNDTKTFVEENNIINSFETDAEYYCFQNVEDAWKYDDYTENLTVSMKWMRGVGIEQDLGSQVIQVKRNALNTITIALDTD